MSFLGAQEWLLKSSEDPKYQKFLRCAQEECRIQTIYVIGVAGAPTIGPFWVYKVGILPENPGFPLILLKFVDFS